MKRVILNAIAGLSLAVSILAAVAMTSIVGAVLSAGATDSQLYYRDEVYVVSLIVGAM